MTDFSALPAPRGSPGFRREDDRSRAREAAGPHRPGRGAARVRGRGPPGPRRLLADAVTGRRCRLDPGQSAGHRGREVHRLVRGDPAELWHRPGARMGGLRRRSASAPGRAGGVGAPRRPGRDHGDARPRDQRGLEGVHRRQARRSGVSTSRPPCVDASQQSYDDSLKSYRVGLGTLTDLLAARRELSRARFVELDTKVQLLEASAALAFTHGRHPGRPPAPDR